ncbi:hypothetical protein BKA70DRAFT_1442196 [Coprinopsis sp. MPI-PUGE-AT-0042]|nr:hypothetical protein BKA70DRAFT_1442196 [Coprinopsis sp. MPI-PUGE-AT-0042]
MSAACLIPVNPDFSGTGVRIAVYSQNLLLLFVAIWALWDGNVSQSELAQAEMQTATNLVLPFAILLSSIVQALTLGMTSYHGTIILLIGWMNNTNVCIYFILYINHKHALQKGKGGVDASWSGWTKHIAEKLSSSVTTADIKEVGAGGNPNNRALSPGETQYSPRAGVTPPHTHVRSGDLAME